MRGHAMSVVRGRGHSAMGSRSAGTHDREEGRPSNGSLFGESQSEVHALCTGSPQGPARRLRLLGTRRWVASYPACARVLLGC